jgi:hypothetical protein
MALLSSNKNVSRETMSWGLVLKETLKAIKHVFYFIKVVKLREKSLKI